MANNKIRVEKKIFNLNIFLEEKALSLLSIRVSVTFKRIH